MIAALLLLQVTMPGQTISTRVESLLARSPVPREGEVAVMTTSSADTVYVGDQVEILTTAWFPAGVRARLRRPPTLRPPSLNGVWSLPVVTLPGVAAQRQLGETAYDLYASHQVVFPVAAGRLVIPPAEMAFSSPSSRQFFGDERREERTSRERIIVVLPLPEVRRPDGFAGPVGRGLQVAWRIPTPNARVGEPLSVDVLVSGEGNLSLWGPPELAWPEGVRVYPDQVTENPGWRGARRAGVRRFRYLLLPDSAGSVTLPEIRYPHFDPLQRAYRVATAAPVLVPILPPIAPGEIRTPPALLRSGPRGWPRQLVDRWGGVLLLGSILLPLAVAVGVGWRRRHAGTMAPPSAQALTRFELVLGRLSAGIGEREPAAIAAELRRVGVEAGESDHAARLHERIRAHRYSLQASQGGHEHELAEESARWLSRLPPALLRRALGVLMATLVAGAGQSLGAQELSSEELYAEGSYEAAALLQSRLVGADPTSAAAWYNLGAMRWMAQHDAGAAAAWLEALRLAPRNATVRRGWSELALRHQQVREWEPAVPVTPEELIVTGMVLWILACLGGIGDWSQRRVAAGVASAAVVALAAGIGLRAIRDRAEGITTAAVPLRAAPHGLAQSLGTVDGVTLVEVDATDGAWVRVRDPNGRPGWVPATSVVLLRGLD